MSRPKIDWAAKAAARKAKITEARLARLSKHRDQTKKRHDRERELGLRPPKPAPKVPVYAREPFCESEIE